MVRKAIREGATGASGVAGLVDGQKVPRAHLDAVEEFLGKEHTQENS